MTYKQFSQELCDANDWVAKETAAEFMKFYFGCTMATPIEEQQEMFKAWDFVMEKPDLTQVKIEVERKLKGWDKSGKWQGWPTIDVPYRKKDSKADVFIMVNQQCDTIMYTAMQTVLCSTVTSKNTIYTREEKFFNVPPSLCLFFWKSDGWWYHITKEGSIIP